MLLFGTNEKVLYRDGQLDVNDVDGEPIVSDESTEETGAKSSLLGRRGAALGRRNSLLGERSRTVSGKKAIGVITEASILSGSAEKRLSLHDLTKASNSMSSLMPPPRAPLGLLSLFFFFC